MHRQVRLREVVGNTAHISVQEKAGVVFPPIIIRVKLVGYVNSVGKNSSSILSGLVKAEPNSVPVPVSHHPGQTKNSDHPGQTKNSDVVKYVEGCLLREKIKRDGQGSVLVIAEGRLDPALIIQVGVEVKWRENVLFVESLSRFHHQFQRESQDRGVFVR